MMARLSGVARGPRPGNVKPYCIQEPPYHVQHGAPLSSTISHVVRTHVPDQRGVSPCIVCEPAVCAARRGVSSGSGGSPRSPLGKPGVPAAAVRDLCGAAPWERGNLGRFRSRRDAGALRKKPQEVLCDVCRFKMRIADLSASPLVACQGVHSQRDCGTIAFEMPLRIDKGGETMKIVVIGGTG